MERNTEHKGLDKFTLEMVNEIAEQAGFATPELKRAVQFGVGIAYEVACKTLVNALKEQTTDLA